MRGLFFKDDGDYQGWLAAFFCCCAAVNNDETPTEENKSRPPTRPGVCDEQPVPLTTIPHALFTQPGHSFKGDEPVNVFDNHDRHRSYTPSRPPSLKPLDLGDSSLLGRRQHDGQNSSYGHSRRSSISAPRTFRRLDHMDAQRQSLIPLRLGPVVLRESPSSQSENTRQNRLSRDSVQAMLPEYRPDSYRINRESPFERCGQRTSTFLVHPDLPFGTSSDLLQTDRRPSKTSLASHRSSISLRRQAVESSASSIVSRPSGERARLKRKRSVQSGRKSIERQTSVEREILELNTIVEERRAENARDSMMSQHVPAVAPAMQVRARSETLDAIGSALSRPVTAHALYRTMTPSQDEGARQPVRRSVSGASRPGSRVSGWLSGIFSLASTSRIETSSYKPRTETPPVQHRRARSDSAASLCTSATELESPSLTIASSPMSKGHSRSHTGDSRSTPFLPPPIVYGGHSDFEGRKAATDENWPIVRTPTSDVGLAF